MPGESPAASPGLGPAFDLCPETEEHGVSDQAGPRPPAPAGRGVDTRYMITNSTPALYRQELFSHSTDGETEAWVKQATQLRKVQAGMEAQTEAQSAPKLACLPPLVPTLSGPNIGKTGSLRDCQ